MSEVEHGLLNYIQEILNALIDEYNVIDDVRSEVLSRLHRLFSRIRKAFNMLYNRDISNSKELLIEIISDLKFINELISSTENSSKIEKVVKDVYREAVEAVFLYIFISGDLDILHHIDFVDNKTIINGFFEFLGEVRRLFIDEAIKGDINIISKYLEFMDSSYRLLFSKYFPNYYFPEYKRRVDMLRSQVEKSKEDYIRIKYGGKSEY